MTSETILLIGRDTDGLAALLETHASRLRERTDVESVTVATYEDEPVRELTPQLDSVTAETVYAVPMVAAHTRDTTTEIPAALSAVSGTVHYCEPLGQSPAITDVLAQRAATEVTPGEDASLVLVSFGSSSKPYQRQTTDYHASRLEAQSAYDSVLTCYLLQNPAVECVRYNVPTSDAVAVPLFLGRSEVTERRIPAALELDRGGIAYADPLLDHSGVTDAIAAEIEKQRTLAGSAEPVSSFEATLTETQRPVATDGDGRFR
ncbi:CbiX/SirB N-terminal domain-containing protein [Haloarcula salinisoli]|uniref:Sirohydrochlorin chelatase n=1 Tax=Haloarcula salinisoli TaxID=2487746 RepID=A0A8J8CA29_9EURY|nr:CbiX/SirB N-terminal domain-containing protein [Halomicroarcula salinisoli]MBX0288291.1 sirohydrochlorin chelatase [Halomicroarcula salinisoli]MBX0305952.1 sirohydrochlorin chelatase [Halomicroarcula salinisoli]